MCGKVSVIRQNTAEIRERIASAARAAGREPSSVTLVAAAKTNDTPAVRAAIEAGVDAVGENRVQEMLAKRAEGAYDGVPLHFIGHLQTNKVRQVVGCVDLIQSVGSLKLARAVAGAASALGIRQKVLLEVNIGNEPGKSGFLLDDLHETIGEILAIPHICVCGLMSIPPIGTESKPSRMYFDELHKVFVDIKPKLLDNTLNPVLSMGMSGDFEEAVLAGATMVRVGSALFGSRY